VLVTGAGGFIGSHLVERLVELGAQTRAFVHYNALGKWGWLDGLPVVQDVEIFAGDVHDRDSVHEAVRGVEVVFHLAALIAIPYSYRAPGSYVRTNVEGTLNILQAAGANGAEKVVHTSTSEVYGTARYVPIDEGHPLQAQSPYSASKIGADKLAEAFCHSFDLPVVTVRPFNTFGPRQTLRAVIPTIISQALGGESVRLGSLTPIRDFTYVKDTVEGFLAVAAAQNLTGELVNLGNGKGIAMGDLARTILKMMNKEQTEIVSEEQRVRPENSEVYELVCDNRKAKETCGWEPTTSLQRGLEQTISWVEKNLEGMKPHLYNV
jgi:dTDP-glucose 4,6-dehydratase